MPVDQVTRAVYRATLRAACKLDTRPALQALIHRNRGRKLPEDFNSVLSVFLGGHHRHLYIPSLLPGPTVKQTVKDAFRFPPGPPNLDAGLMGMRFLHGICHAAERHGLLPDINPAASPTELNIQAAIGPSPSQVSLQAVPEPGCILVSHPLLRDAYSSYFHQTVVLLCRHSFASGTYGLFLNRYLSTDAKAKVEDMVKGRASWSSSQADSSGVLDLARDMPAAMKAMLGDRNNKDPDNTMAATAAAAAKNRDEDDDEDDDVSFLLEDPGETSVTVSFTSNAPVLYPAQPSDDEACAPSCDEYSTVEEDNNQRSSSTQSGFGALGHDQKRELKLWQARIKRPPPSHAPDQPVTPTTADPQDIADPRHPLRFHQFITNMKRFTPSPLLADPQDGFEPVSLPEADLHAASSRQQGQPPPQHPAEQFGHSPSAGPGQVATALSGSASSSQRKADTSAPAYSDSVGSSSSGTSSSTSQGRETRAGSQSGTGRHNSLYRGLMNFDVVTFDVMSRTLSRGGPVPGGQVLHNSPELGGDAVQEPCEESPGVYVGCDRGRAQELLPSGKLPDVVMRFFVGETQWSSQQLESELAQGSWLLLSPSPQLMHDMSLKPHNFIKGGKYGNKLSRQTYVKQRLHQMFSQAGKSAGDVIKDLSGFVNDIDQQALCDLDRDKLREQMWQETMARAGKPFADLINIPTQLVKELMDLKY